MPRHEVAESDSVLSTTVDTNSPVFVSAAATSSAPSSGVWCLCEVWTVCSALSGHSFPGASESLS